MPQVASVIEAATALSTMASRCVNKVRIVLSGISTHLKCHVISPTGIRNVSLDKVIDGWDVVSNGSMDGCGIRTTPTLLALGIAKLLTLGGGQQNEE